jgi:hypothetical protein
LLGVPAETGREPAQSLSQVAFLSDDGYGEGQFARVVLDVKGAEETRRSGIDVVIHFEEGPLLARDLRALWTAVRALENTLRVVTAVTGGRYAAASTE